MHVGFVVLEVAVSNGLGRARRRIFPAGVILVYKTCRPIRAICAVHPHRRDVRAGSPRVPQCEHAGLVGCRGDLGDLGAGSEKRSPPRRRVDGGRGGVSTNETRRFSARFLARGRVPALRGPGYVLSSRSVRLVETLACPSGLSSCIRSPVFLQSLGGWSSG